MRPMMILVAGLVFATAVPVPCPASADEPKTLKERLSDKASDEQRVDNCRVPVERRGTTPRPDCPAASAPAASAPAAGPARTSAAKPQ
jgi:hypothetical protein